MQRWATHAENMHPGTCFLHIFVKHPENWGPTDAMMHMFARCAQNVHHAACTRYMFFVSRAERAPHAMVPLRFTSHIPHKG